MRTGEWTSSIEYERSSLNEIRQGFNIVIPCFDDYRFEKPSAIQQRAIMPCCKGW